MNQESINKLKDGVINAYRRYGDDRALLTKNGTSYTGNQLVKEIQDETEFGLSLIDNLIHLTIDLIQRDRINSNM